MRSSRDAGADPALPADVREVRGEAVGAVHHRAHAGGLAQPASLRDARARPQVRPRDLRERRAGDAGIPGAVEAELERVQAGGRGAQAARDRHRVAGAGLRAKPGLARMDPEERDVHRPAADARPTCHRRRWSPRAARRRPPCPRRRRRSRPRGVAAGSASATSAQRGMPPMAAMSERLTARAFQPMSAGAAEIRRKWTSSISRSVVARSLWPGGTARTAVSSPMPISTPGAAVRRAGARPDAADEPALAQAAQAHPFGWLRVHARAATGLVKAGIRLPCPASARSSSREGESGGRPGPTVDMDEPLRRSRPASS